MKRNLLLALLFLLFLGFIPTYSQDSYDDNFIDNPIKWLNKGNSEDSSYFKLSDLGMLTLKHIVFLAPTEIDTTATTLMLVFDHIKTELPIDFYMLIDLPGMAEGFRARVRNVNFVYKRSDKYYFVRYFPHDPDPFYRLEGGSFNLKLFVERFMVGAIK